jgi:hypothetical protein
LVVGAADDVLSSDRGWWAVVFDGAEQIELHPCNVVPAAVFPSDAAVEASLLETEGSMETVARVVGLGDAGEGPPVSAGSKPLQ